MTKQTSKVYHFFLLLSLLNILTYYVLVGQSTLGVYQQTKGPFSDTTFNYFLSSSVLLVSIWLVYYLLSRRLTSSKLIWMHLMTASLIIFIAPWLTQKYFPMPRAWITIGYDLTSFFGVMTSVFMAVSVLLVASEIFLFLNIRQHDNTCISSDTQSLLDRP